ncbi:MAG TPA: tetratricopeptide repeat protein [Streptosporangiaceae bacterium]
MNQAIFGNMGGEANAFVGRERELAELRQAARSSRALTLCGAGGIGKTRLALQLMASLGGDFPDGVWFVELADLRQPELVVSRIASVVEVTEEPGRPLLETLAEALRGRRMLLALDNCEHLIDECARTCQRLLASAPGLRVIATSREPLRVAAEAVWQVPPLSLPPAGPDTVMSAGSDAVRLFAERAAAVHPGFVLDPANAAATAAICRALDGMPLAIELAAAWVRVLSVPQIKARLGDRFGLLTSGERTAPPRQRTLRAAIDWSYDLLSEPGRVLLRRLSVFAGWSLDMAEQVCADGDPPAGSVLDLLSTLVDQSLVVTELITAGEIRYRLLDTVREYAASRLAEAGESALLQARLRDYTLREVERLSRVGMALTAASWGERVEVFRRFDADVGNLRLALSYSLAQRDAEAGLRICAAARPVWIVRGSYAEGAEWLDSFLSLDLPPDRAAVRGPALISRAQLALPSDPARAEQLAAAGLELCRSAGDDEWSAAALNLLAEAALHGGRAGQAAELAGQAISVARRTADRWNEGYGLGTAAAAAGRGGRLPEAQQLADESLAVMRAIDHQWGAARTLLGLGDLARLTGDAGSARDRYAEALRILREVGARPEIARCLAGLGRIAMDQGDLALARQRLTESIELSHAIGSRIGVIRALEAFAALEVRAGRAERAVQLVAAAAASREAARFPPAGPARTRRILDAAGAGEPELSRLWAAGSALAGADAVALALDWQPAAEPARLRPARRSGRAPSPAVAPGPLTPREREIVTLIAQGCSNKAIAEALVISPATAARHVANILGKLGFTSRAQIAAWAPGSHAADRG